ncbi:MAG: glycosyltransferase family 4 protein [Mobiluncus porci]|uniref:Glycosyltransferase family 4 protein n=1 Tax=Mobiluncus porci TaxID=2652278 RepID=A0A7K0K4P7_9ACTO|nr:glycosyltransferase family 4 protein [Mobiluncus porci]MDD7542519.1 glycosyltransferase family 4 protein [Mobiluncus porci]MDY5748816.1 glycosyltransferase family 4 protein [Mobiluncus porci]MST50040.1 glycosyltransferase family 4 protein [Mobiluncus porci]
MKVTAVSTWFPTEKAPASGAFIVKDLHAIAEAGVEVRLVHLVAPQVDDGTRELEYEGIKIRRIPFRTFSPVGVARVGRVLPTYLQGSDVVHSMAMSALAPVAAARAGSLEAQKIPWVHTEHWSGLTNPDTLGVALRVARPGVLALEKLPDVVTSVCPYLSAPIRRARGESSQKPTVEVPCVVEPASTLTPRRDTAKTEPWRLVSVGGLVERKDPIFALKVVAELLKRGRSAELTWVGSGPLEEASRNYAASHGVTLRLTGPLPPEDVYRELQSADLFIGPTHGDNFFVSCAEAILNGRPVAVGAAGGHPDYMRDFVGIALEHHDVGEYADAVEHLLNAKPNEPSAEAIAGSIGQAFSSATVGMSYRRVYEAVLESSLEESNALLAALPSWRGW